MADISTDYASATSGQTDGGDQARGIHWLFNGRPEEGSLAHSQSIGNKPAHKCLCFDPNSPVTHAQFTYLNLFSYPEGSGRG